MAMATCRECKAEVSDQAKTCPKCGVKNPVKKTSLLTKVVAGFVGLTLVGGLLGGLTEPKQGSGAAPAPVKVSPKDAAIDALKIEGFKWTAGGFGSIMLISLKFKNEGARDVKDIEVQCDSSSNSGTKIDTNKKTVFELVKAGKSVTIREFNMGFINNQAAATSCRVTDLVLL
jgi:ribosomal protein L40E